MFWGHIRAAPMMGYLAGLRLLDHTSWTPLRLDPVVQVANTLSSFEIA